MPNSNRPEDNVASLSQLTAYVDARLAAFDRSRRRWRRTAIVACTAAAAMGFVLLGGLRRSDEPAALVSPVTEKLAAQALEVRDAAGKLRARLGLSKDGSPALELFDGLGAAQASLALGSFERPEDARIREATRGRSSGGHAIEPTDDRLTAVLRLGRQEEDAAVEIGSGDRLRVVRLRDSIGDERMELRVGPYTRPDLRANLRARAEAELDEVTFRLKAPNEFLAMELGVEPLSLARPDDRRGNATGTLIEQATPYLTMYGWCEEPVFLLSNWAFDRPSIDLWEYDDKKAATHLFAVPGADEEEKKAAQRTKE